MTRRFAVGCDFDLSLILVCSLHSSKRSVLIAWIMRFACGMFFCAPIIPAFVKNKKALIYKNISTPNFCM